MNPAPPPMAMDLMGKRADDLQSTKGNSMRFRERVLIEDGNTVDDDGELTYEVVVGIDLADSNRLDIDLRATMPSFKFGAAEVPARSFNVVIPAHQLLDALGYLTDKSISRGVLPLALRGPLG